MQIGVLVTIPDGGDMSIRGQMPPPEKDLQMTNRPMSLLCRRVRAKGFVPAHVAEVGVWHPHTSNIYSYIVAGVRTTLVEPDPESIAMIKSEFGKRGNVTLHEVAVCDFHGHVELCKRDASTFVSLLTSAPAVANDGCDIQQTERFTAEARLFNDIDDGTIDLLSVDTEGSEWFVVQNLVSRPAVISLETHGGVYVNPYLDELTSWLSANGYVLWYKDKSDSVYVRRDAIALTLSDKLRLIVSNVGLSLRSLKKRLGKRLKNRQSAGQRETP